MHIKYFFLQNLLKILSNNNLNLLLNLNNTEKSTKETYNYFNNLYSYAMDK